MAEKLQSLLDKINEKGVKEAEATAAGIIAEAKKEAEAIRAKAKADAEAAVRQAEEQAEGIEKRAEAAVRQAARDIILELRQELEKRMTRAVSAAADQALTPEFMASLIKEFAAKFATDPNGRITVLTAVKDVPALDKAMKASLGRRIPECAAGVRRLRDQGRFRGQFQGRRSLFRFHQRSGDRACRGLHRPPAGVDPEGRITVQAKRDGEPCTTFFPLLCRAWPWAGTPA